VKAKGLYLINLNSLYIPATASYTKMAWFIGLPVNFESFSDRACSKDLRGIDAPG